jgi:hypothetical protein
MVAGLPKDPVEPVCSVGISSVLSPLTSQRGAPRQTRSPNAFADASLGMVIGGFSLRGEARSIGI